MPADPAPPGFVGYKRGMMVSPIYPMPIPVNVFLDPLSLVTVDPAFKLLYDDVYAAFVASQPVARRPVHGPAPDRQTSMEK